MSHPVVRPPVEIVPGRFYEVGELSALLPTTLYRVVLARLHPIADVYLGKAIIDVIAQEFVTRSHSLSPISSHDRPEGDVMTLHDVATYLRVSETTVRRMVLRGQLIAEDHREPGSRKALYRFSRAQVEKDRRKAAASSEEPPVASKFRFPRNIN